MTGLCDLCAEGHAEFSCDRCGRLVCDEHYDPETGFCERCAGETRKPRSRVEREEEEGFTDGVDTHRL